MGKKSTKDLIRGVVDSLKGGRKSITDISTETGLDRTAISRYLKILNESGLLVEELEGASKIYSFSSNFREDTYFGLPLSEKSEKQASSLFYLIRENWDKITDKKLFRTTAQKIAYEVIKKCNLEIPTGWYIYGGIAVVVYDTSKKYDLNYVFSDKIKTCIKETTLAYSNFEHAFDSKNKQYEDEQNELYLLKEEILKIFYSQGFYEHPKKSIYIINKKLRKLFRLVKTPNRKTYSDLIDAFDDLMTDIYNKLDEKKIIEINRKIISLFESVWKYIAMFNFRNDLSDDYSNEILESRFIFDIVQQEDEIVELGTELQSIIPVDPLKKELRDALDKIVILNEEEQKEKAKEIAKLKKELGEQGYKDYLLKKLGLK